MMTSRWWHHRKMHCLRSRGRISLLCFFMIDLLPAAHIHLRRFCSTRFRMSASRTPSAEPGSDLLFPAVIDGYGKRLALVFGNHAHGGHCPFLAASLCHHCDIGMG